MSYRGIDVRELSGGLLFRAFLLDSTGALLTTGTSYLYLFELQTDGTLKTYDWTSNTFKASGMTADVFRTTLTVRTGIQNADAALDTGLWTKQLTVLTGFTAGNTYLFSVYNAAANPAWQARQFQGGSGILADVQAVLGTQLPAESVAGRDAAAMGKFLDVASPTGTINSLPGAAPDAAGGLPISDAGGLDLDAKLANTNEITAARMGALTDLINGGRLDLIVDALVTYAAAIKTKTDLLGTAAATVRAPVSQNGLRLELRQGDDYTVASGQPIEFADTGDTWPELSGATLTLTVQLKSSEAIELAVAGALVSATKVRFEPTAAITALLTGGHDRLQHWFTVLAELVTGEIVTLAAGEATVWAMLD